MRREKMRGIPKHLRHKPIYGMNRYETMDGVHKNNTDVVGMSVGKAQWCGDIFEPSVKIWRDIRKDDGSYRISGQSEETTLTRAIDMATLAVRVVGSYLAGKEPTGLLTDTVFDNLYIEDIDDNGLKLQLEKYIKAHGGDIKRHIALLKSELDKLNL